MYEVQGLYEGEWESVFADDDEAVVRENLNLYRAAERGTAFRMRRDGKPLSQVQVSH